MLTVIPRPISIEAKRPDLPIERIEIQTRHRGNPPTCDYCEGQTTPAFMARERWGESRIVFAEQLPVYRCSTCDIEYSDIDAVHEFLTHTLEIMQDEDPSTAAVVRQELALAIRHQQNATNL